MVTFSSRLPAFDPARLWCVKRLISSVKGLTILSTLILRLSIWLAPSELDELELSAKIKRPLP